MDLEDCREVASAPSCFSNCSSPEPNRQFNEHSPGDLVWADSCLVNHPEHLNGDWNSVKYALHEILKNKPSSSVFSSDVSMEQTDSDAKLFIDHPDYIFPNEDEADTFLSQILECNVSENHIQDVIQSSYNGSTESKRVKDKNLVPEMAKVGVLEASSIKTGDNGFLESETDCLTECTETRIEEDGKQEFLKRLEKALKTVSIHLLPSSLGGSVAMNHASVDDMIARIRQISMDRSL